MVQAKQMFESASPFVTENLNVMDLNRGNVDGLAGATPQPESGKRSGQ